MNFKTVIKLVIATIIGEIALIFLTTIAQEVLVNGVYINSSSPADIVVGGTATLLAGMMTGVITTLISSVRYKLPIWIISFLITLETCYLIMTSKTQNPTWFDIISAFSLIVSVWCGYYIVSILKSRTQNLDT